MTEGEYSIWKYSTQDQESVGVLYGTRSEMDKLREIVDNCTVETLDGVINNPSGSVGFIMNEVVSGMSHYESLSTCESIERMHGLHWTSVKELTNNVKQFSVEHLRERFGHGRVI
jgi:hypothetical protein